MRIALVLCFVWMSAVSAIAQNREALRDAVAYSGARNWQQVEAARAKLTEPIERDIVDWLRLRGRQGSFAECRDFVRRNADWPGLKLLRLRCEYSIARGSNAEAILEFFADQLPQTGVGSLRLAGAYLAQRRSVEAARELRRGWLTFNLTQDEHDAFVQRNGATVAPLHEERLDMLLWRGNEEAARRMFPLVSDGWKKLAEARMALRSMKPGVNGYIDKIPRALKSDPGLAYERFVWRIRRDFDDRAAELLIERSTSPETLGKPEEWANRRRSLARQMMREGKPKTAYRAASRHFLTSGSDYADLEWLSGYVALRKLDDPRTALDHFERFEAAVATPISLGRAGYWKGRAHEALGNAAEARAAYEAAARYQSSFYGQLAAERAQLPPDPMMAGTESFPDWRTGPYTRSSVFAAGIYLQAAGVRNLAERFFVHLSETQDRAAIGQLADLALALREPHIALMLSKQAARQGHELYKTYYPLAFPEGVELSVPQDFALSIARRESEFDPMVISPAGARGLMQLMPKTAREMSRKTGEEFSERGLLTDAAYNARLGVAYMQELAERYDNNPVLMSVAYNAGPARADRWMKTYGNPRRERVDIVDWIEGIPFRETRNYVMRVTEGFAPYRARSSGEVAPISLTEELKR